MHGLLTTMHKWGRLVADDIRCDERAAAHLKVCEQLEPAAQLLHARFHPLALFNVLLVSQSLQLRLLACVALFQLQFQGGTIVKGTWVVRRVLLIGLDCSILG